MSTHEEVMEKTWDQMCLVPVAQKVDHLIDIKYQFGWDIFCLIYFDCF